ncbi:response regulator transcription factor [Thermoflavimicrobium dichotomicum]|uniref:Two-component system, NarL family, response regulator LiaR n=1 Tax=Thermoflavimicrobium dichotomicum TaxID=46223 RepID=A0A1I3U165_9BACL|nr:response regulator transcription factor [Thermoflavimicrobium dichotomicum]SFJ76700.1 two-component system, NarL family, response regulator LiaR [Thermoflavimicrobium dichotomicum]
MIRVMIVDDHEMVRIGLATYLKTQPDFEVVAEAANGKEAVRLSRETKPDVVLMDLVMNEMDGIEATREICRRPDAPKVIVLTSFIDDEKVYPALEAGAFSYLLKTSKAQEIADAIRQAMKGQPVLEAEVTGKVLSRMRRTDEAKPHEALTAREMQILKLVAEGKTNQEIADALFISIRTVKTHITHILDKLQVDDRTQAAVYAHRNKLVD